MPEENSLYFRISHTIFEIPSINLVFFQPRQLLGEAVHARFGDEFPIRFDFLDTMDGGNLSLQVHPLTEYIQEKFGMHYTQDESYYIMDAKPGAHVFLGLKEGVMPEAMIRELEDAQDGASPFDTLKIYTDLACKKTRSFSHSRGHCTLFRERFNGIGDQCHTLYFYFQTVGLGSTGDGWQTTSHQH